MEQNLNNFTQQQEEEKQKERNRFNVQNLIMKYFIYWKWFVVSVIICLVAAFFKLKYTTPIYNITATIMLQDKQKGDFANQMQTLEDFGFMQQVSNIDNEVEVLTSKSLIKQTIIDLKLYTVYTQRGRVGQQHLYNNSPVTAELSSEDVAKMERSFGFEIKDNKKGGALLRYMIEDKATGEIVKKEENISTWPYLLHSPIGEIALIRNKQIPLEGTLNISFVPPLTMAKTYLGTFSVTPTSKTTSVARISFNDASKERGISFVNKLVANYNKNANDDKDLVAKKTEEFINERLQEVDKDLGGTESELENYKRSASVTDVQKDAELALQTGSDYDKKRVDVDTQIKLLGFLRDYVYNPSNNRQVIPSNVGLTDASLISLMSNYNEAVLKRNNLLLGSTEKNPAVVEITSLVDQLSSGVKKSLDNLYASYNISKREIESQARRFSSKISSAPTVQRELTGIERQQTVKSGLYVMLLQKREENALVLAATTDNVKIIDDAIASDSPVSPKRAFIWLIALFFGLAIPVAIIYILELMRYKIEGRNDLDYLTSIPVLGDVALSHTIKKGERAIVVKKNKNDMMAETFRAIRTNLQFTLSDPAHKVILFTSTTSGEGKTFVSSNMAASLALLGKKVILIGLDIRKPRLAHMFGLSDRNRGITAFLAGDANDKDYLFEQISHTDLDNLDVLPSGTVPPNPAELLAKVNLDKAIEYLSEVYDYIILDTPPVGLVTDTFIIGRVANASVFICRADYTPKAAILQLDQLKDTGKLPNISLVLNGVDMVKKKYGYYYGYGRYGMGYGYGKYGYGYGSGNYGYGYGKYGSYGYDDEKK